MTVARVDLETGEILADMTPDEARHITDRINDLADDMTALVLDAYERGAWKALGYSTWEEYAQTELKKSRRYSYNLIDHGRVVRAIEEVSGVRHGAHDIFKAEELECERFPGWRFHLDIAPHGQVTRLEVTAPSGITAKQLQAVPLGALRDAVARRAVDDMRHDVEREVAGALGGINATPGFFRHFLEVAEDMPAAPIAGTRDDGWYVAHVAAPYALAERTGKPNKAVAEHLRALGRRVSDNTVRGYVYECRHRRGLLPKTQRGKAGGGLTRKGERILKWLQEEEG